MKFSLFFSIFASPWVSHAATISNGVNLRILPLGDSITYGAGSSDGNGYRLALQNMLSGNNVQYVGSQHSGSMANNSNEGHGGAVISQIAQFANLSLKQLPNVILLMAGTNDMNIPTDPTTASDRLGSLIDELVIAVPDAAVLVAQLIPSTTKSTETNIEKFNAAVEGIVAARANAKKKVLLVDMSKAVTTNDLADALHPNDEGYIKMATAWYNAIQQSFLNGWISPPQAVSTISSRTTCPGPVQWISKGLVAVGVGGGDTLELFFADINGDGKSDYLVLDANGETKAWFNGGLDTDGSYIKWNSVGEIAGGVGKARSTIRFADLNGDGLDDYLTVDPTTGAVAMWQNGGGFDSAGGYKWTSIGTIASGVGIGAGVFFADMDGDGKDDYVWLDANGAASLWLNGGMGKDGKWIWNSKGKIATGVGAVREDIRLADIDGDGKADYLWVDNSTGATKMWRNGGVGSDGNWIWTLQGEIAIGVGTVGSVVRFANLGGTGRADYLTIVPNSLGVRQWLNGCGTGSGVVTVTSVSMSVTVSVSTAAGTGNSLNSDPTATITGNNMSNNPTATVTENNMPAGAASQALDSGTSTTSAASTASRTAKSGAEGLRGFRVENMVLLVLVVAIAM